MTLQTPDYVKEIIDTLCLAGYEAYIVGGCVRDMLFGKAPADFDVATNALPTAVKALFKNTADTGLIHGTVTVICGGMPVEVTTFRTESGYSDSRHPESVVFVNDIKSDLCRRDFTVNAMAYNEKTGLIDCFGGKEDLQNRILRAVGDPEKRFAEDALRILRLFRFSAVLGFKPETSTLEAALSAAETLSLVSSERIAAELIKAANGVCVSALSPLLKTGALEFLGLTDGDIGAVSDLPQGDIRLFALLNICGKNPLETAKLLKLSNKRKDYIKNMLCLIGGSVPQNRAEVKICLNRAENEFSDFLLYLKFICGVDTEKIRECYAEILRGGEPYKISHLAVSGDDLAARGIRGKTIGETLDRLLAAVIANPQLNRKETLINLI